MYSRSWTLDLCDHMELTPGPSLKNNELSWTIMNYHQLSHNNSLQSKQMSEKTNETTLQGFAASRRWSPPAGGSGSGCAACQFEILWLSCWDPLGYAGMTTSKKIHNLGLPGAFKSTMVQGLTTPKLMFCLHECCSSFVCSPVFRWILQVSTMCGLCHLRSRLRILGYHTILNYCGVYT